MIAASMIDYEGLPAASSFLLISYPLNVQWALASVKSSYYTQQVTRLLKDGQHAVLVIAGDSDNFTRFSSYESWLKDRANSVEFVAMEEMDHFWFNYEHELVHHVDVWLGRQSWAKPAE